MSSPAPGASGTPGASGATHRGATAAPDRSLSRRGFVGLGAAVAAVPLLPRPASAATPAASPAAYADPVPYRSIHTSRPPDPAAVLLGSPGYEVHADGVGDDTAAVQAALDEASRRGQANGLGDILLGARDFPKGDGGGVVLVPEGSYRLTSRVTVPDSVRVIGYGRRRPLFVLAAHTPGYADGTPREMFGFLRRPVGGPVSYANNDTFGSGLINLDLRIEPGNPDALAVRFGGAQLCVLQDLDIEVGEGLAGIDHNANLIQRVRVFGGDVGLQAYAASAGWQTTLLDCRFEGQRRAAVTMFNDAKLTVVRAVVARTPRGFESFPDQWQHLYVERSHFDAVTDAVAVLNDSTSIPGAENDLIRLGNQFTLLDCTTTATPTLLRRAQSGTRTGGPGDGVVRELTYGLRVEDALTGAESRRDGVSVQTASGVSADRVRSVLRTDAPPPPPVEEWVSVADVARRMGRTIGRGADDLAVFQAAVDRHDTVFVPIGQYHLSDTLALHTRSRLIGLHPRQTWLRTVDAHPHFGDPDRPRALLSTPHGGRNHVSGLGLDTAEQTPGAVSLLWRSGPGSQLADITTQFVKWHPEGAAETGNPGYTYRGRHKHSIWVRGGGGTFANIWSANGWSDNGLLVQDTAIPARLYELSVEHHERREVVLSAVAHWEFLALQTEDHIHGWRSQAAVLDRCRDLLFANSVFFRVATVLGPHPSAMSVRDSRRITLRGNRGYRDKTPEFTQWGAAVTDARTGRRVPEPEFTLIEIGGGR
ncbi:glycosyl hydrolase family 28-related protein [Streptomyces indicus]|uniref:Pectate lyase superfamily protein n=1 Tax=Streptomyces indicus TaxID=417292 RepID=A0A1G8UQ25_9ACTN|nr:glycosyl hydrolase family 28-related protein [Streptomyces indicus]SDJ55607.1 Pectate lyase superfamily protein [Streptomyces indicus]